MFIFAFTEYQLINLKDIDYGPSIYSHESDLHLRNIHFDLATNYLLVYNLNFTITHYVMLAEVEKIFTFTP